MVQIKRPPEAFRSANLFQLGIGHVVVSRFRTDGSVEAGCFLLDVFCLGAKEAFLAHLNSIPEYERSFLTRMFPANASIPLTASAGRKLVESAVAYASGLGFGPCTDYRQACRVFGGISALGCEEDFAFGSDGRPCFFQGPSDSPARCRHILRVLDSRCGRGNYNYVVAAECFDGFEDSEKFRGWDIPVP
jgi:hypothetical protein